MKIAYKVKFMSTLLKEKYFKFLTNFAIFNWVFVKSFWSLGTENFYLFLRFSCFVKCVIWLLYCYLILVVCIVMIKKILFIYLLQYTY